MSQHPFSIAPTLGLTLYQPPLEETLKWGKIIEPARGITRSLSFADLGSLSQASKTWRLLSLNELQKRSKNKEAFADSLFVQGCSLGALRVARCFMTAPYTNQLTLMKWTKSLPLRNQTCLDAGTQFALDLAAACIQADCCELIQSFFSLTQENDDAFIDDERWNEIKRKLCEKGELLPLLTLLSRQIDKHLLKHSLPQLKKDFAFASSCYVQHPDQKEKVARWLMQHDSHPDQTVRCIIVILRQFLQLQHELKEESKPLVDFLLSLDISKSMQLSTRTFVKQLVAETKQHPSFTEFCIDQLLQSGNHSVAKKVFDTSLFLTPSQQTVLQEKLDLLEAEILSIASHQTDQTKRSIQEYYQSLEAMPHPPSPAVPDEPEDEEFFRMLEELDVAD